MFLVVPKSATASGYGQCTGIVGFGLAAELAGKEMEEEIAKLTALRDKLIDGILKEYRRKTKWTPDPAPSRSC